MKIALLVPTRNAQRQIRPTFKTWLKGIAKQSIVIDCKIAIDSESIDSTKAKLLNKGWQVISIPKEEFDHGATRNQLLRLADADICIFLTQDAILAEPDTLSRLIEPFKDPSVAVVSARQLPRQEAGLLETQARLFNYPEVGWRATIEDIPKLGVKAAFVSNSCAAWRKTALMSIGGFPETLMGEDTLAAAKLLQAGFTVVYEARARVYHSHGYSLLEESRRYFDIGVFHRSHPEYLGLLGKPEGEGLSLIRHQFGWLYKQKAFGSFPGAILRLFCKYGAYRLGRDFLNWIPVWLRPKLSLHPDWWKQHSV